MLLSLQNRKSKSNSEGWVKFMQPVIYLVGPTASGKTGLSVALAKRFLGEIVSGDSMQIYRDMHIATAAPDLEEMNSVKHHLFEFLSPTESFSVSRFVDLAEKTIDDIHNRDRLPFVVGGTGLYISSLAEHVMFGEEPQDINLRQELYKKADTVGLPKLYEYLCKIDPKAAEKISPNDKKRILRAIEIFEISGQTKSERDYLSKQSGPIFNNFIIGLAYRDRELLYERINRRVDIMLERGLLSEAQKAYGRVEGTAAQAIGHKELFPYFAGEITLEEAVEHLKMQTRRYAKRQMTWFNKMENIHWIYMDEDNDPIKTASIWIEEFLNKK